jgi:hypothetical protein
MTQRNMKRKGNTAMVKQGVSKQGAMRTVNAGGVLMPVPRERVNTVKGGLIGGGASMALMACAAAGPVGIIVVGMLGLGIGAAIGSAVDEEKARR